MARRSCPTCRTTVEPRREGGQDVCPKCDRRLSPVGAGGSARSRSMTDSYEPRERTPTAVAEPPAGGRLGLSILLLVGGFVVFGLFIALVVFVKTQGKPTPTTNPYQVGPGRWEEPRPWEEGPGGGFTTRKWEPPHDWGRPTTK